MTTNFKPEQKLPKRDVLEATKMLNQDPKNSVSLIPKTEDIFKMNIEEIKVKYPERYKVFIVMMDSIDRGWGDLDEIEEMKLWIKALNNLQEYTQEHNEGNGILRDRQVNVFEDLRFFIEAGKKRGKIILPTGVGKTILFTEFTKAIGLPTLIVVPTQILVNQTGDKIDQFAPEIEYGKVYTNAKQHGRPVTIITYDSLIAGLRSGTIKPEDYKVLILDEAHESLTDKRQNAIQEFEEKTLILEFTATDKYSENKKLTSETIHELTIKEAVEESLLSSLSCIIAKTTVDLTNVKIGSNGEYDPAEFEEEIRRRGVNKACVEMYEKGFNGKQAVVFSKSISHGNEVRKEFNKKFSSGFAECLNGDMTQTHQESVIKRYRSGEIKVLIGVDLLTRGFDAPEASVCLNLVPTFSLVRATQRGGRVLRIDEKDLLKHAVVVDFLFEDKRKKHKPILFSEVVGQAAVLPKGKKPKKIGGNVPDDEGPGSTDGPCLPDLPLIPKIEGIEVIVDEHSVMEITNQLKEDSKQNELAPEGWETQSSARIKFGVSQKSMEKFWLEYSKLEGYVKDYKNTKGQSVPHLSPLFCSKIKEIVSERAPEGWIVNTAAAVEVGVDKEYLAKIVGKYIATNNGKDLSKLVFEYRDLKGRKTLHYSPKFIEILKQKTGENKGAPEGWMTNNIMSQKFDVAFQTVDKITTNFKSLESMAQEYKPKAGAPTFYFSPQVVEIVKAELNKRGMINEIAYEYAPIGWFTGNGLAKRYGTTKITVDRIIQHLKNIDLSREIVKYKDARGKAAEHLSQKLVGVVVAELKKKGFSKI